MRIWTYVTALLIACSTPISYGAQGKNEIKTEHLMPPKKQSKAKKDNIKSLKLTHENVYKVLLLKGIKHPDIVMAQICLESSQLTSPAAKKKHNLLGIYKGKHIKGYRHWSESIDDYKKYFTNKYKGGCYYTFLTKIGYATDPEYIQKIKKVQYYESKKSYCKQRKKTKMV